MNYQFNYKYIKKFKNKNLKLKILIEQIMIILNGLK